MEFKRIAALVLSALLVMSPGTAFSATKEGVLSVTGSAQVYMKATKGKLTATVTTENTSVRAAIADNATMVSKAIKGLEGAGIEKSDIATSNYRIAILRDYSEIQKEGVPYPIAGYSVSSTLKVAINDLSLTGPAIDSLADVDGLEIGQLSFTTPDNSSFKKKAISGAVKDGKLQAKEAADDMDVSLGRIKSIRVDTSVQNPSPIYFDKAEAASQTTIIPDEVTMTATVYIDYYIK